VKPILSILIATRNRIPYCINVIETILSFDYENFELVVQDNSDTLELKDFVTAMNPDRRLVYNYSPPPFSSIDNFNAVIGMASGEYLCLIGDDDGINPEIFQLVEWMDKNNVDAVKPALNLMYRWPDACELLKGYENDNGSLTIEPFTTVINKVNVKKELKILLKQGGLNYLKRDLPKLYHGVVKREYLEIINEKTGHYVGGLSPDIYFVVALSTLIENVYKIDYPITIPGVCADPLKPGGHMSKIEKLEDAPHFRARGHYKWSIEIPRFFCAENIWAESAMSAIYDLNEESLKSDFNLYYLHSVLLRKYSQHAVKTLSNIQHYYNISNAINRLVFNFKLKFSSLKISIFNIISRIQAKVLIKMHRFSFGRENEAIIKINNLENIHAATNQLLKQLDEQQPSLVDALNEFNSENLR
jgi:glycosyltransferase involved in cell wall biosynthesis